MLYYISRESRCGRHSTDSLNDDETASACGISIAFQAYGYSSLILLISTINYMLCIQYQKQVSVLSIGYVPPGSNAIGIDCDVEVGSCLAVLVLVLEV